MRLRISIRKTVLSVFAALVLLIGFGSAYAVPSEKRVALVIGNGAYPNVGELPNPPNDAKLISETLRALDFDVIERVNAGQKDMKRAIKLFGEKLEAAGKNAVGLFYFAGHGVQVRGVNYLIPVNVDIEDEGDVDIEAVSATAIQDQMRYAGNRLNLIVMDACRNNPFKRSFRSASRGLARMDATKGTLIAYATSPGDVAADGSGENSPYTEALSKALLTPGLTVERVFKEVRNSVVSVTNNRQVPWEASSLTGGDFYFTAKPVQVAATVPAAPSTSTEVLVWNSIKDTDDPAMFRGYLKQYPSGIFAAIAKEKVQSIEREKVAADAKEAAKLGLAEEHKRADSELKRIKEEAKLAALNPNISLRSSVQGDWNLQLVADGTAADICGFDKRDAKLNIHGQKYEFQFTDRENVSVLFKGTIKGNKISNWSRMHILGDNGVGEIYSAKLVLDVSKEHIKGYVQASYKFACYAKIILK